MIAVENSNLAATGGSIMDLEPPKKSQENCYYLTIWQFPRKVLLKGLSLFDLRTWSLRKPLSPGCLSKPISDDFLTQTHIHTNKS